MSFVRSRRLVGVLTVAMAAGVGIAGTSSPSMAGPQGPLMDIQILSFNDFHGNLEGPSGSSARLVTGHELVTDAKTGVVSAVDKTYEGAGGVEYLATHLRDARKGHANTVTVAAGDIIGASPLLSAAFHDEPTIEAMNALGLEATAVGNHEFDEGYQELLRMQSGGCLPDLLGGVKDPTSCATTVDFPGANFKFLAANVKYASNGKTILPPYWIKDFGGAKIGFIGMTLKETPSIVTAAGIAGLEFTDEVKTANALVPVLRAQGVKAIVVLVHQGGTPAVQQWVGPDGKTYGVNATYDYTCGGGGSLKEDSAILPIAANLDPQIDVIISGHTHQPYVCNVPDPNGSQRLVTSASSFGRLFTETNLKFNTKSHDIVRPTVDSTNMIVTRGVAAADETSIINNYKTLIAPIANRELGHITATLTRNTVGESTLGDLIADAQVNDPTLITGDKVPVVAFMNPGGIRTELNYPKSGPELTDGIVCYEEAFTVQPFNNYLVSMDMTGAEIRSLLAQQWTGGNAGGGTKFLQVSAGLHYTVTGADAARVVSNLTIGGTAVNDATVYRIVTNNFLADGGDNFAAFKNGTPRYFGGLDIDGFAKYMAKPGVSPYTPVSLPDRITQLP